jgi:hypothetical protein
MESLHARCKVVAGIFVAIMVVSAVATLSNLSLLNYLQGISSGEPVDDARAEEIDARQAVIGVVQVGLFLACAISFLMWFHRAHKNLKAGGLDGLRYTPGWAVGGFFVPFLNLVRPFQLMMEVWAGSAYLSRHVEARSWRAVSPSPHVGWWWALFLLNGFFGNVSRWLMLRADELGELLTSGWVTLASDVMDIPAALVGLLLVRGVSDFQERARTRLQTNA